MKDKQQVGQEKDELNNRGKIKGREREEGRARLREERRDE